MNILSSIVTALGTATGLPIATGAYKGTAKNYIVLTPVMEWNEDIADDADLTESADADVNLYYVGSYLTIKDKIKTLLKAAGFFISDSHYVEYDKETDQHHHVITVEKKTIL